MATGFHRAIHMEPTAVKTLLTNSREPIKAAERLTDVQRIFLIGTGTSFTAAMIGEYLLRLAGIEAWAVRDIEFVNYPRRLSSTDAVFVLSSKADSHPWSNLAIQQTTREKILTVGITTKESKMQGADIFVRTVEHTLSPASTISYIGALTRLAQITANLAALRGYTEEAHRLERGLTQIPALMEGILVREDVVRQIAQDAVQHQRRVYFVGAGPNISVAFEGAIKVKETSYMTTEGFELEQCIQAPQIAFEPDDLIVIISAKGPMQSRMVDFLFAVNEIGPRVLLVGNPPDITSQGLLKSYKWGCIDISEPDGFPEELTPLLTTLPVQLLADFLATARGTDADSFREDDEIHARAHNYLFKEW